MRLYHQDQWLDSSYGASPRLQVHDLLALEAISNLDQYHCFLEPCCYGNASAGAFADMVLAAGSLLPCMIPSVVSLGLAGVLGSHA
ncbi:hypothetical protein U1Q18_019027 [Sarracenia purpurea var. burkii]